MTYVLVIFALCVAGVEPSIVGGYRDAASCNAAMDLEKAQAYDTKTEYGPNYRCLPIPPSAR